MAGTRLTISLMEAGNRSGIGGGQGEDRRSNVSGSVCFTCFSSSRMRACWRARFTKSGSRSDWERLQAERMVLHAFSESSPKVGNTCRIHSGLL